MLVLLDLDMLLDPVVSDSLALEPITFYPGPAFPVPTLVCAPGNVLTKAIAPRDDAEARAFESVSSSVRKPIA
uniref:Uncharacterized protein n=1 Tax=Picea glauca TaxID=3330 RepID=A0A101LUR3_PICGL|nr:hypothetical protein ABT39_MTgene2288 [Picea glauca]QHR92216.1 hypothetical protein Q903MT_gene6255 [Picea sitchensis]